ncbi:uncharacterized protein DUF4349 [Micromonospora kangleipakensis]|uniref:Uncharacterized protein DUF4349 n=1 Tax=Micromonospora kangleipakensis TaxID=1077942 RepID=A0A4Q8B8K9_9ACTN|nr:DUF4349 domain-containing protein [Micromonospora kangleipakensis]RZU73229.1 uncharacterized protein DUF4349 [Micromonospora kangleipakensis]
MSVRTGRRRGVPLAAVGLVAVLLAGGCGAGEPTRSSGPAAQAPAGGAADQGQAEPGKAGAGAPDLRVDQRSIIYTGTMQVQVDDVERAAREAIAAVTAAGGFVGGDQRRSESADARAELELRVPAAKFTAVVDELAKLGRQQRREVHTQDVTEETVDLDARITSQRARVESARKLLDRATSTGELVNLENELGRREADLASLEAKKRRLADLTALSTITVTFVGRDASTEEEQTEIGFLVGLRGGWEVFLASVTVLLTVLGALLPWLVAFGVPVALLVRVLRRSRRRRTPPAGPTPLGPPAGPTAPPPVPATRSAP